MKRTRPERKFWPPACPGSPMILQAISFAFWPLSLIYLVVTVEMFKPEIAEALKAYDKFIVCLDKTPEECEDSLTRLMEKAIKAYINRGTNLRHGIALDKQVTIILSQT